MHLSECRKKHLSFWQQHRKFVPQTTGIETYLQQDDILLFGTCVATFPNGIKEAFDSLVKALGNDRSYYRVNWFVEDGRVVYYAMTAARVAGEAKQRSYETLTLLKRGYRAEKPEDWMSQTDCIKDVFHHVTEGVASGKNNPSIEWYIYGKEMLYMVRNK